MLMIPPLSGRTTDVHCDAHGMYLSICHVITAHDVTWVQYSGSQALDFAINSASTKRRSHHEE